MPSDDQKKDDSKVENKVENHVNHDDKSEEPQKDEDTTQGGNGDDVVSIPVAAIRKIEIKPEMAETERKDGTLYSHMDVSNVTWLPEQEEFVRKVMEKAVGELKLKILQLAAKSKKWRAETVILREGSFLPFPGEICLIVPLIRAASPSEKVSFYFIKDKKGPTEAWQE
ncbi:hypothetical protein F4803DRAFT_557373 [Xylaria telfairii]|nr:hypothetical protein F4803DRAFT_557373 [Xylaria telfairii]